ncbi:myosin heavy chain, muscle-like [Lepeophtheirus salmonis]
MPGHIKLGSSNEPDPDPLPYLVVSNEMKRQDMAKPYDPKKSVWVPTDNGQGFVEGLLDSETGGKSIVMVGHEKKTFKPDQVGQVNPPKFEKCEDMANLTYLNDASVFNNLKTRYQAKLIYTYSGLFCVVVNPYKRYPIYTPTVVKLYLGKRRNEVPPHLWAITETAYRNMLQNSKDQSMLITGESGAGKTENTKKVISYLAMVASSGKKAAKKVSLEDQIVATNPILESYGNAKTSRNDNSSRFGKFIRIHFTTSGKLAGCDIESYLLEKSRITQQQAVERSYHIFYQLLQPFVPDMKEKCCLGEDIYDYSYVSQGKVKVESIDDNEELEYTDSAFDIIGFTQEEKWNCYKLTAAVMSMGEMKFKQKGRDEQCEPDGFEIPSKIATLFGVECENMMKCFVKPRIKVGTEWVTKGQNIEQATNAVGGIARAIFDRLFKWLIIKCNDTLIDTTMKKSNFVAVLDIAGFEIFEYNGFEQISINFVNEKLQQFFNHHMFVVEQEEYLAEGIDWVMVDFGMDLAAAIIMFEKPMGIWAILEEESLFPKATDRSFEEKLKAQHLGKSAPFAKPQSKTDKNAHFAIIHYAGIVSYNVTGWLEKNKDPVNDTVVDLLKKGSNALLVFLWREHPGQTAPPPDEGGKKKKKGSGGKTVSSVYLVQLNSLMSTLHKTEPHFIRCIVPNTHKKPLEVEPPLIMHQLTCNGVLEGIRICMRGFPNRILYHDFKQRYAILGASKIDKNTEMKKSAEIILANTKGFDPEKYKLGHTKVFFRAGALAVLEEKRDDIVTLLIRKLQGTVYGHLKRKEYKIRYQQKEFIKVIQRNFRKYKDHRDWPWFIIIQKTRPLIGVVNVEEELRILEEKAKAAYGAYQEQLSTKETLQNENNVLNTELVGLRETIKNEQGDLGLYQEKMAKFSAQKADFEHQLNEACEKLEREQRSKEYAQEERKDAEREVQNIKHVYQDAKSCLEKSELEKQKLEQIMRGLNDEVLHSDEIISKLNKDKKHLNDTMSRAVEELVGNTDKVNHLNDIKAKLEKTLDQMEGALEKEKRNKSIIEKRETKNGR